MASSENLASIEEWSTFRPSFADSWISEAFARDTETLSKALQKSIYNSSVSDPDSISPLLSHLVNRTISPAPTPTASHVSGSDPEAAPKRPRKTTANSPLTATGKVSKRKARTSKRSQTTFITADQANFRQMVQQVTGVGYGNMPISPTRILKPEPQRVAGSRLANGAGSLPTLDTSAFLLDHQQPSAGAVVRSGLLPFQSCSVVEGVASAGATLHCDNFPSFPTLESWKL